MLVLVMFALAPIATAQDAAASIAAELEAARHCDKHQRPRQCVTAEGELAFQCRVKSPLAGLMHWFESPGRDDHAKIVLVHAPPSAGSAVGRVVERTAQRVVERRVAAEKSASLPKCKNSNPGEIS